MLTLLAPSEGLIMMCMWEQKEDLTVAEIRERLETVYGREYAANTVATFLKILTQKGYVTRYKIKGSYQYKPIVSKEEYLEFQNNEMKNTWHGGSLTNMMVSAVKAQGKISAEEARKLRELLDEYTD